MTQFTKADKDGDGVVTFATFKTVAHDLPIPESALSENNIEKVYYELGGEKYGINIKECMNKISEM